ncbi:MAG: phenylacetate--CoA ligase family protein [Alphaproteobacteria bacterium]
MSDFRTIMPESEWPAVSSQRAAMLAAMQYQLERTEWLPPEALLARQFRQLGHVLRHANETVPLYRRRFSECGIDPGAPLDDAVWQKIPLLTRAQIQDAGDLLCSTSVPESHGQTSEDSTSGSTGIPVKFKGTSLTQLFWLSFTLRDQLWRDTDFSKRFAAIRYMRKGGALYPGKSYPGWGQAAGAIFHTGPSYVLNMLTPVSQQLQWLHEIKPDYLLTYPTNLMALIAHARASGQPLPPFLGIQCFGEILFPEMRSECREATGIVPADMYSTQEVGYVALQCPKFDNLHVQSENVLVEVLDNDGNPCRPGETGHVVVSTLHNFAMPFIRYKLGDFATVGEPCPCGRGLPVIARVMGRVRNMLTLPNGERLWPYWGTSKIADLIPLRQFQLVQKSLTQLEARIVPLRPFTAEDEVKAREVIFKSLGHNFAIAFTYHEEIPRGPGGKFEDFKSELPA